MRFLACLIMEFDTLYIHSGCIAMTLVKPLERWEEQVVSTFFLQVYQEIIEGVVPQFLF